MIISHHNTVRNSMATAVASFAALGTANAKPKLQIASDQNFQDILVELLMSVVPFGSANSGVITAAAISDGTAIADGTAAYCRVINRDEAVVFVGTVTDNNGNGDAKINTTSIITDDVVSCASFTYTACP